MKKFKNLMPENFQNADSVKFQAWKKAGINAKKITIITIVFFVFITSFLIITIGYYTVLSLIPWFICFWFIPKKYLKLSNELNIYDNRPIKLLRILKISIRWLCSIYFILMGLMGISFLSNYISYHTSYHIPRMLWLGVLFLFIGIFINPVLSRIIKNMYNFYINRPVKPDSVFMTNIKWSLSIIIILNSILILLRGSSPEGGYNSPGVILFMLIGVLLLPPIGKRIEKKYGRKKKNWIIYSPLIILLVILFLLNNQTKRHFDREMIRRDSLRVQKQFIDEIALKEGSAANLEPEIINEASVVRSEPVAEHGAFASALKGENSFISLENNLIKLSISTKGGRPYSVELKEYKNYKGDRIILFDGDSTVFGFNFWSKDQISISTNELFFKPVSYDTLLIVKNNQQIVLKLYAGIDNFIEYKYSLAPNSYKVDFQAHFIKMGDLINIDYLKLNWEVFFPQQGKNAEKENIYTTIAYKHKDEWIDHLRPTKTELTEDIYTELEWIACKGKLFSCIIIAEDNFEGAVVNYKNLLDNRYLKYFGVNIDMDNQLSKKPDITIPFSFYFGPNRYKTMKQYKQDFEKMIPLRQRWFSLR